MRHALRHLIFASLLLCVSFTAAETAWATPGPGRLRITLKARSETGLQALNCPAVLIAPDVALFDAACLDPLLTSDPLKPDEPAKLSGYTARLTTSDMASFGVKAFKVHPSYKATRCEAYKPAEPEACASAADWCDRAFASEPRSRLVCRSSRDLYARAFMARAPFNQALAYLDNVAAASQVVPLARQDVAWLHAGAQVVAAIAEYDGSTSAVPLKVMQRGADRGDVVIAGNGFEDRVAFVSPAPPSEAAGAVLAIPAHPTAPLPEPGTAHFTQYTYGRVELAIPWILATMETGCGGERVICRAPTVLEPTPPAPPAPRPAPQPSVSPTPEVSPKPDVKPTPEVSPTPDISPKPDVTPTPDVSPMPDVSPTPDVSPKPSASPAPESRTRGIPHSATAAGCIQAGAFVPLTAAMVGACLVRRRRSRK